MVFRILSYMLFSIVAAPFEIWVYFFNGLGDSNDRVASYPWTHGLLYVVSILLLAETSFRIVHHWNYLKSNFIAQFLLIFSLASCCGLIFFYGFGERLRIIKEQPLMDSTGYYQNWSLKISFVFAWIAFALIEYILRLNSKKNDQSQNSNERAAEAAALQPDRDAH